MSAGNPFLKRIEARNIGHNGRVAENDLAKRLGGRTRPGSGNIAGAKGDVVLPTFLVENKATETKTMSLKQDWLLKIYFEALEQGKTPALSFQFTNDAGKTDKNDRWVVITEAAFKELTERDK